MATEVQRQQKGMARAAVHELAQSMPGKIIAIGAFRALNLETEPGHVQTLMIDPITNIRNETNLRIRIGYAVYGSISNASRAIPPSEAPEGWDGEPKRARDLTPEDAEIWDGCVIGHVEMIRGPGRLPEDKMERAYEYISERWVPDFTERETLERDITDVETQPKGGSQ